MTQKAKKGDYAQIHRVELTPGERGPNLPEDTRQVPFELRVRGFLDHDASVGDDVTITTPIGRKQRGTLEAVNPPYEFGFGEPVPELMGLGPELRKLLGDWE